MSGDAFPVIGSADATHVLVFIFDYTCKACRQLHRLLDRAVETYPRDVAVMFVPVPNDATCNPRIPFTGEEHVNACEYARLGLAVWRADWTKYAEFAKFLGSGIEPPPMRLAAKRADELVGDCGPVKPHTGEIDVLLDAALNMLEPVSNRPTPTPSLLFSRATLNGEVPTFAHLDEVLKRQLGLSPLNCALRTSGNRLAAEVRS